MIERIDHVGLVVRDLQGAIDFYTDLLGFEISRRLKFPDRELVILSFGDNPAAKLELLKYEATDTSIPASAEPTRLGLRHLALHVSEVSATYDWLKNEGVTMLDDPPFQRADGPPIAFGLDPEGILLEFTEID